MGLLQPVLFVALLRSDPAASSALCADAAHALSRRSTRSRARVPPFRARRSPSRRRHRPRSLAASPPWPRSSPVRRRVAARAMLVADVCDRGARARAARASATGRATELHMLDVGQGDAIALRTPRGRWMLVDAGRSWLGGDAGRSTVVPYLAHRGGALALFVLSHPHADHVGGAASVVRVAAPGALPRSGLRRHARHAYLAALGAAARARIPWQRVHPGDSLVRRRGRCSPRSRRTRRGSPRSPTPIWRARCSWRASARSASSSPATPRQPEEDWLLSRDAGRARAPTCSRSAITAAARARARAFLGAVRPRLALVCVGAHNAYGHPSPEVLQRSARRRARRCCAPIVLGTIVVSTDGRHRGGGARRTMVDSRATEPVSAQRAGPIVRAASLLGAARRHADAASRVAARALSRARRRALAPRRAPAADRRLVPRPRDRVGDHAWPHDLARARRLARRRNCSCTNSGTSTSLQQIARFRSVTSGESLRRGYHAQPLRGGRARSSPRRRVERRPVPAS